LNPAIASLGTQPISIDSEPTSDKVKYPWAIGPLNGLSRLARSGST